MKVSKTPLTGKVCLVHFAFLILLNQTGFAQVDVQVDPYTGAPQVFIPLGEVSDRDLSYGIGLSYSASGVKVDEGNDIVGVSWRLVGVCEVKRELRGLPDDYSATNDARKGWLYNNNAQKVNRTWPANSAATSCASELGHYNFINGLNYLHDTEPDLFHFSAGALNGSFVFDNTGSVSNIKTIPYQEVKISVTRPSGTSISQFEIVDNFGTKYLFSQVETTEKDAERPSGAVDPDHFRREYHLYKEKLVYNSAWKLTKIVSPKGEVINFGYLTEEVTSGREVKVAVNKTGSGFVEKILYSIVEISQKKLLSSVSSPTRSISLIYEEKIRTTYNHLLNQIIVNEINNSQSSFLYSNKLEYFSLKSSIDVNSNQTRYFIKKVYQKNPCESLPPYVFDYHSFSLDGLTIPLPGSGSPQQDIWGYFKSTTATHKFPKLYVSTSLNGHHRISLFPKSGAIVIDGADRTSSSTTQTGMLAKITLPSKGTHTITYSPHEFLNPVTNSYSSGGGLRVTGVSTWDGVSKIAQSKSYEYTDAAGALTGKLVVLPTYSFISGYYKNPETGGVSTYPQISGLSALEQWKRLLIRTDYNIASDFETANSAIVYSSVTEKMALNGKTVYTYDVPGLYGSAPSGTWDPTYTHVARNSGCASTGVIKPGYYTYPYAPSTPFEHNRGLLRKVTHYKEGESTPVKEVNYDYLEKSISSATVKGLNYDAIPVSAASYFYMYAAYSIYSNRTQLLKQVRERVRDEGNPTVYVQTLTDFSYASNHTMVLTKAVTNSDGSIWREKFRYVKDYGLPAATTYDQQSLMIKELASANRYGTLVESTSTITPSGGSELTISGSIRLFEDFGASPVKQILPFQIKEIDAGEGIVGYVPSSTTLSGTFLSFEYDARYRPVTTREYTLTGSMLSETNSRRESKSYHYDETRNTPIVKLKYAKADEVVYSTFDHATKFSFDLVGAFTSADKAAVGRTGNIGLSGITKGQKYLRKTVKNKIAVYTLATWVRSNTAGTYHFEVTVKTTGGTVLKRQILNCPISQAGKWEQFKMDVDLSAYNNPELIVEVGTTDASFPITVDDVAFYPKGTDIAAYTYLYPYGVSSETASNQLTSFYSFDGNGRLKYVYNSDGDILQKYTYTQRAEEALDGVPISIQPIYNVVSGEPTTLIANTACLDFSTLQWKVVFGSGTAAYFSGSDEQPYTFPNPGTYQVYLKISHYTYGFYETTINVTVDPPPLQVGICMAGPSRVDLCGIEPPTNHLCRGIINNPQGSTSFRATILGGCAGSPAYSYKWYKRASGGNSWILVGTEPVVSIVNVSSYDVYCSVSSSNGCSAETTLKSVNVFRSQTICPAQ